MADWREMIGRVSPVGGSGGLPSFGIGMGPVFAPAGDRDPMPPPPPDPMGDDLVPLGDDPALLRARFNQFLQVAGFPGLSAGQVYPPPDFLQFLGILRPTATPGGSGRQPVPTIETRTIPRQRSRFSNVTRVPYHLQSWQVASLAGGPMPARPGWIAAPSESDPISALETMRGGDVVGGHYFLLEDDRCKKTKAFVREALAILSNPGSSPEEIARAGRNLALAFYHAEKCYGWALGEMLAHADTLSTRFAWRFWWGVMSSVPCDQVKLVFYHLRGHAGAALAEARNSGGPAAGGDVLRAIAIPILALLHRMQECPSKFTERILAILANIQDAISAFVWRSSDALNDAELEQGILDVWALLNHEDPGPISDRWDRPDPASSYPE